jgi:hypothetical protein
VVSNPLPAESIRGDDKKYLYPYTARYAFGFLKNTLLAVFFIVFFFSTPPGHLTAEASSGQPASSNPWHASFNNQWGGHVKVRGSVSWPDNESYFKDVGTGPYYDGHTELRLKSKLSWGEVADFVAHYEAVFSGGDTRRKEKALERLYPGIFGSGLYASSFTSDKRRLFDLTKTIDQDDNYISYHRLDRLYLTLMPQWGSIRIGRQAITWGNGMLFNPMDLFNPFAPSDIEREYKIGDDMAAVQFSSETIGDFQFLYVPRRETDTGDVEWSQSSLAGKLHITRDITEFDIMAAKHYKDALIGLGSIGYLGDTAWRIDATWTFLDKDSTKNDYLSFVANIDYSWVWLKKNFYGYVEYFFNGLCHDRYTEGYRNSNVTGRISRGELFTLGRHYLSGHIKMELHPLFAIYLTVINNVEDPSGSLQPRAVWNMTQNTELTFGGNIYYGGEDTEYGGFTIPYTSLRTEPSDSAFIWLSYYF